MGARLSKSITRLCNRLAHVESQRHFRSIADDLRTSVLRRIEDGESADDITAELQRRLRAGASADLLWPRLSERVRELLDKSRRETA